MKKYGVIGEKLSHSLSPKIHGDIFTYLNLNANYDLIEIKKEDLKDTKEYLINNGYEGINITIPYKTDLIKILLDEISPEAEKINAINTVKIAKDGSMKGYNTDYFGFGELLKVNEIDVNDSIAVILGNGGACKAVYHYLKDNGAKEVYIASRTKENKIENAKLITYDELKNIKGDILINTTPLGMYPNVDNAVVGEDIIANFNNIIDVIYNPFETKFLKMAKKLNKKYCNGLYMLVAQGVKAEEIFQDVTFNKELTDFVYKNLLNKNIVLIGMPGCGKTTFGKMVADNLYYDFIDMDEFIEQKYNMTIPEMFEISESYFRKRETEVAKLLGKMNDKVIATGGGVVKNEENIKYLKENSIIIFIDRSVDDIMSDVDISYRPLLAKGKEEVLKLYNERYELYKNSADIIIKNDEDINIVLEKILGEIKK